MRKSLDCRRGQIALFSLVLFYLEVWRQALVPCSFNHLAIGRVPTGFPAVDNQRRRHGGPDQSRRRLERRYVRLVLLAGISPVADSGMLHGWRKALVRFGRHLRTAETRCQNGH